MNMKSKILRLTIITQLFIGLTGCTTPNRGQGNAINGDEILSTSNGARQFPQWAYEEPRAIKDGFILVSGNVDISADQSPARCLDAAALVARANLSSEMQSRLQGQFQYASEGLGLDQHRLESIINQSTESRNLIGVQTSSRWYAKVKVADGNQVSVVYRCFALAQMPIEMFKVQMASALRESRNGKSLTPEFSKKINESWDTFFGTSKSQIASKPITEPKIDSVE
jgi:hypothetical protein